jgi:hypothetical protein
MYRRFSLFCLGKQLRQASSKATQEVVPDKALDAKAQIIQLGFSRHFGPRLLKRFSLEAHIKPALEQLEKLGFAGKVGG